MLRIGIKTKQLIQTFFSKITHRRKMTATDSSFINIQNDVAVDDNPTADSKWRVVMIIIMLLAPAVGVGGGILMKETTKTDDLALLYATIGLWATMIVINIPLIFIKRSKYFLIIFIANIIFSVVSIIMTFVTVGKSNHTNTVKWYISAVVLYCLIYNSNNLILLIYKDKHIEETTPAASELQSPTKSEKTPLVTKQQPKPATKPPAKKSTGGGAISEKQRWWTMKQINCTLGTDPDNSKDMAKEIPKDEFLAAWKLSFEKTNANMVKWGTTLYNAIDKTNKGSITVKQLETEVESYTNSDSSPTKVAAAPQVTIKRTVPPQAVPDVNKSIDIKFIIISVLLSAMITATFFVRYVYSFKLWLAMAGVTLFVFLAYCFALVENRYWEPLKNSASMHALSDRLAKVRARPAKLELYGECYHYKSTSTTAVVGGVSIKSSDREKVVSQKFTSVFPVTKVCDNSDLTPDLSGCNVVAIHINTQYCFATKETREKFVAFQREFNDRHRNKDHCYEFGTRLQIPNLERSILGLKSSIWWITWYYYVHTWAIPPLVYLWRRAYDRSVKRTTYTICKQYWA